MAGTLKPGRSDEGQGHALTDKLQEPSQLPQSHAHDANADNDSEPAEVPLCSLLTALSTVPCCLCQL